MTYDEIDRLVYEAEPFTRYIDPDDVSFFHPANMVDAINSYLVKTGQSTVAGDDIGQIVRIVYESLAMKYRQALEILQSVCEIKFNKISIIGGGSKINHLNQFTSFVTGLDVYVGPNEASSIGNIIMQAYGAGEVSGETHAKDVIRKSFEIKKISACNFDIWNGEYLKFCSICRCTS